MIFLVVFLALVVDFFLAVAMMHLVGSVGWSAAGREDGVGAG